MRKLNKSLLSSAILAVAAGTAQAGTEACFEIYQNGVNANHSTLFAEAQCSTGGTRSASLLANAEGSVAYELTKGGVGGYAIDLGNSVWDAVPASPEDDEGLQIVYIPTTDVPGASRIQVTLTNAVFSNNANQIFLLSSTDDVLATSDGQVDGEGTITFLTQSGTTIPAGTRMLFSQGNTLASQEPVEILTENTTCTDSTSSSVISIQSATATTDGGSGIIGGVSAANTLIDISPQFVTYIGSATDGEVNAQSTNSVPADIVARTEFVFEANSLTLQQTNIVAPMGFINRALDLDIAHTLVGTDDLEVTFSTTGGETGSSVAFGIYNQQVLATGALAAQVTLDATAINGFADVAYAIPASAVFAEDEGTKLEVKPIEYTGASETYNEHFFTVTQTDTDVPMGFNYAVNVDSVLNFDAAELLDHCSKQTNTQNVGINGAVLKVPYAVNGAGNFVRITNEHNQEAEVTVDLFAESADGTATTRSVTSVALGTVPAKSSVVYFVPEIISEAASQENYLGSDGGYAAADLGANAGSSASRHTLTFAVTAPKDSVHGVTVQKIAGGVDRVMPVLDQNAWSQ